MSGIRSDIRSDAECNARPATQGGVHVEVCSNAILAWRWLSERVPGKAWAASETRFAGRVRFGLASPGITGPLVLVTGGGSCR